jgi:hypothetical protein
MDKIVIGELHYISAVDEYEWLKIVAGSAANVP